MEFKERLRALRIENKLTQEELGEKVNLTKANISKYETGRIEPNIETINYLANFFNVTIDYLLGKTDVRNPYKNDHEMSTRAFHNLDKSGLPEEAIKQIEEYVEFVKQKYNKDGSLKVKK